MTVAKPSEQVLRQSVADTRQLLERQQDHLATLYQEQEEEIEELTRKLKELKAQNSAREDSIELLRVAIESLEVLGPYEP